MITLIKAFTANEAILSGTVVDRKHPLLQEMDETDVLSKAEDLLNRAVEKGNLILIFANKYRNYPSEFAIQFMEDRIIIGQVRNINDPDLTMKEIYSI